MSDKSIYDGPRLAQPDEVWNYRAGDGIEKAILPAHVWRKRHPEEKIEISVQPDPCGIASCCPDGPLLLIQRTHRATFIVKPR